jgi:GTP:adenosylcobinamide-phosphate guanylyltransferase
VFTAIVLAGSRGTTDPVAASQGLPHKCLVKAAGVPMLCRVLDALLATPSIGRAIVVLQQAATLAQDPDVADRLRTGRVELLEGSTTPSLSVAHVLTSAAGYPWLVTTADHPLLTPQLIEYLCRAASASGADVAAGLTGSRVVLASYPQSHRTWLRFSDERYSGANLFALMTPRAELAVRFWRRIEQERKRPWRMAMAFGLGTLAAYLLRRLSLDDAMQRISGVIGCTCRAIPLPFAEAAIDVDKPADLELVESILRARAA